MKLGVTFPQTEIGPDPVVVRDYIQAAEGAGFDYVLIYDHVIGAAPETIAPRLGRAPGYIHTTLFHEPFVLYGYLAALTRRLELVTGVVILPQRQTVLIAKQAAEVDVLSGGRLRLGVGLGWNFTEYAALNETFENRGRRVEEQIEVLRRLWTEESVTFEGKWHRLEQQAIVPLPVQRPIPIWLGGSDDRVLRRAARLADGWYPLGSPDEAMEQRLTTLRTYTQEAGRDPAALGIDARVDMARTPDPDTWVAEARVWDQWGASHLSINTMNAGLSSPAEHIDAILRFKQAMDTR